MTAEIRAFKSIEGLRGYMAWSVVAAHVMYLSGYAQRFPAAVVSSLLDGTRAVNVFIIVSGFVITHLVLAKREPYRLYIVRRGLRIVPIYYLCLLLAFLLQGAQLELHGQPWVANNAIWVNGFAILWQHLPLYVALHAMLLHGIVPDNVLPMSSWEILGPAWSLSLEWQFYLIAPFLLKTLRRGVTAQIVTIALLAALFLEFRLKLFGIWLMPAALPLSIHFFLLGILCRLYFAELCALASWVIPVVAVIAWIVCWKMRYEVAVWGFFLYAATLEVKQSEPIGNALARIKSAVRWLAGNRGAVALGKRSYSTYLIHIPFLAALTWCGDHWLGLRTQSAELVLMVVSMPILVWISIFLYKFVEAPFIRMGARYALVKPIVPVSV